MQKFIKTQPQYLHDHVFQMVFQNHVEIFATVNFQKGQKCQSGKKSIKSKFGNRS